MNRSLITILVSILALAPLSVDAGNPKIGMNSGRGRSAEQVAKYVKKVEQANVGTMRLWFSVESYNPPLTEYNDLGTKEYYGDRLKEIRNQINGYSAAKMKVTLTISGSDCDVLSNRRRCPLLPKELSPVAHRWDGSKKNDFDKFLEKLFNDIGVDIVKKVDAIEIWNEWSHYYGYRYNKDMTTYVKWNDQTYVDNILKAGIDAVRAFNAKHMTHTTEKIKIYAGSVTADKIADIKKLVDRKIPYVDAYNFHPYVRDGANMKSNIDYAKTQMAGSGKLLVMTEWGCKLYDNNFANQKRCIKDSLVEIQKAGIYEADFFRLAYDEANQHRLLKETLSVVDGKKITTFNGDNNELFKAYREQACMPFPLTATPPYCAPYNAY